MEMFEFPSVWLCINEVLSYCTPPDAHKPGGIQKLPESHIVSLYWNDEVFNTWLDSRVTPLTIVKEWCLTHNSQLWGSGPRPSNRVILTATLPSGSPFRVPGPWSPEELMLRFKDNGKIIEYLSNFKLKDFYRFNTSDSCQ